MVNKQYNVQSSKKLKTYSPPPNRSVSEISSAPNPTNSGNNLDTISEENNSKLFLAQNSLKHQKKQSSAYGKNLTTYLQHNSDEFDICDDNCERLNHKDLSIKDIGRFQYILQMDREMVCGFNFI